MNLFLTVGLLITLIAFFVVYSMSRKRQDQLKINISELDAKLATAKSELEGNAKTLKDLNERNKSEIYAGMIVSQMNQGVMYVDQNRTVQYINSYAGRFMEATPTIGKPYNEALHFLINNVRDYSLFESALAGNEQTVPMGAELVTQRGKVPVSGTIIPLVSENNIRSIVFIFADNSQNILRVEEEKAFFSAAAHELRTPLTAIHMSVLMIVQQFDTLGREKIIEFLTKTNEKIESLISLVNDFLNVSRIEQGRMTVNLKSFNMVALTEEVIKEFSLLAKERKLFIIHEPVEAAYRNVTADPVKTKEVLTNLISNSIKYTIRGGVTISHKITTTAFITRVTDTGNGISPESQRLLFKGFFQVGAARLQSSGKGSGLGLYISRKIARLMHGEVALESSEIGKGSVFTFSLPLTKM